MFTSTCFAKMHANYWDLSITNAWYHRKVLSILLWNLKKRHLLVLIFRRKNWKMIIKNVCFLRCSEILCFMAYHRRPKIIDTSCKAYPDPEFVNVWGAQYSIPKNRFHQAWYWFLGSLNVYKFGLSVCLKINFRAEYGVETDTEQLLTETCHISPK
jgi:hypothetical protein